MFYQMTNEAIVAVVAAYLISEQSTVSGPQTVSYANIAVAAGIVFG